VSRRRRTILSQCDFWKSQEISHSIKKLRLKICVIKSKSLSLRSSHDFFGALPISA
jgi:hypothetical protein